VENLAEKYELKDIEGVGPATVSKLEDAGFYSVESIAVAPIKELMDKSGISFDTATKIAEAARQLGKQNTSLLTLSLNLRA